MYGADILRYWQLSALAVRKNVEGVTHDESLVRPESGGSNAHWLLGHMVTTRCRALDMAGLDPVWSAEQRAGFDRHSEPKAAESAVPFDSILSDYERTQEMLEQWLEARREEAIDTPLEGKPSPILGDTVGSALASLAWHEAYHAGQLGLLRRLMGKDPAIR